MPSAAAGLLSRRCLPALATLASLLLLALPTAPARAQIIETSSYRVVANIDVKLPMIGTVQARSTDEISGSNWLPGCETLDRDFADYDQCKDYIAPLGIKRLRMQAGWNKTEKVKGQHDFAGLDHTGLQPWLQTSYGKVLYPGGGGAISKAFARSERLLEGHKS